MELFFSLKKKNKKEKRNKKEKKKVAQWEKSTTSKPEVRVRFPVLFLSKQILNGGIFLKKKNLDILGRVGKFYL